ncbi:hypothetical protein [Actinoplanes xinjiangensis]|jgi:hypothetical protein|uniref:Uncharacterized protein n=1 Tax=Actinoplanes xinjiangensis TaxID=512350 RepID=A0A316FXX4_9ACTN|nr:hypothetical protein [Actinoplanes xinjiangensis]PWK52546.1 hypothetical protein BC793_101555 [Actinoplanes xinjiangensis]GIF36756.1 hypothetical protein Axi01nite_10670 [Actinoplanes xinjiangensis]
MTTATEDPLIRVGRWALAKVWFGVVLSGGWVLGRHFDWPQAFLTAAAVLGAVTLALASSFLPVWTRQRPSGIPVADVGLRVMVWGGLVVSVIALLVGMPAVGMVSAALLLNTAARTFGDPFAPLLRRLRITPAVRHAVPGRRLRPEPPARPAARPDQTRSRRPAPARRAA